MFYTYILYSAIVDRYYIGSTENPEERLRKHNHKSKGFTNRSQDWAFVFLRPFATKAEAMDFEKQIKRWKSRKLIEKLILEYNGSERPDA